MKHVREVCDCCKIEGEPIRGPVPGIPFELCDPCLAAARSVLERSDPYVASRALLELFVSRFDSALPQDLPAAPEVSS